MQEKNTKSVVKEVAVILLLSAALALIYNYFSPKGISLLRKAPQKISVADSVLFLPRNPSAKNKITDSSQSIQKFRTKGEERLKIITIGQLSRILSENNGMIIDARDPESFKRGHIRGAKNFFGDDPTQHFESLLNIPRDTLIIIYCNNPECDLGRNLLDFMKALDFINLYIYDGGWDGWVHANMPIEKPQTN